MSESNLAPANLSMPETLMPRVGQKFVSAAAQVQYTLGFALAALYAAFRTQVNFNTAAHIDLDFMLQELGRRTGLDRVR